MKKKGEEKIMNIKKRIIKYMSLLLSFSIAFIGVVPTYATEAIIPVAGTVVDGSGFAADVGSFEEITVAYKQASTFYVTIPKIIVLGGRKQATYSVKVSGDIDAEQCVYVAPVDSITDTKNIDFYMRDQATENRKDDVLTTVTQNKIHWNSMEAAEEYEQTDNLVSAPDLTAGTWRGTFQMEIKLETHVTHKHNYVDGVCAGCGQLDPEHTHNYTEAIIKEANCTESGIKTFTCECGDTYTEVVPAKGHSYGSDDKCTDCGELKSDHIHNYTEVVIKEATCTETGIKTFTCECGDSHTGEVPAKGHSYGSDDKCTDCGELKPDHVHSYTEVVTKEATCTENGMKTKTCNCGDVQTETVTALGHDYSDIFAVDKAATCTTEGSKSKHCTRCDAKLDITVIPIIEHNYIDGSCTVCGKEDSYEIAPANAYSNWNYTLDDTNNIITLNYYKGAETNVIVYANYIINGKTYKTQIASNSGVNNNTPYMFNGYKVASCKNIKSIKFSDNIDTSNLINMKYMFYKCTALTSLDISSFDTSNVTDMSNMFGYCESLTSLDISSFDTSNVTDMVGMFSYCRALTSLNLSNFNTSKVTSMIGMFRDSSALINLDVSSFDTSNVTNMNQIGASI